MKYYLLILSSLMLSFCIHKRVHKAFKQYCPYKVNDILVFQNETTLQTDTIFVTVVRDLPQVGGPGPYFVNRHTYICEGVTSDFRTGSYRYSKETQLIEIIPDYQSGHMYPYTNGIFFSLSNRSFNVSYFVSFEDLQKKALTQIEINGTIYKEVYEIKVPIGSGYPNSPRITKFYWSRDNGYLKLVTEKKENVLLIKKSNDIDLLIQIRQSEKYKHVNWRK